MDHKQEIKKYAEWIKLFGVTLKQLKLYSENHPATRQSLHSLLREFEKLNQKAPLKENDICDICASFQKAVIFVLKSRLMNAFEIAGLTGNDRRLIIAGGVAANKKIRGAMEEF